MRRARCHESELAISTELGGYRVSRNRLVVTLGRSGGWQVAGRGAGGAAEPLLAARQRYGAIGDLPPGAPLLALVCGWVTRFLPVPSRDLGCGTQAMSPIVQAQRIVPIRHSPAGRARTVPQPRGWFRGDALGERRRGCSVRSDGGDAGGPDVGGAV